VTQARKWKVGFYKDLQTGAQPAREWLEELEGEDPVKARAAAAAFVRVLRPNGVDVCETEWGKNLGGDLYEFRIRHPASTIEHMFPLPGEAVDGDAAPAERRSDRHEKILLRIFFTTYGQQVLLLCSGYDKGRAPGSKRQAAEIARARAMAQTAQANLTARKRDEKARRRG